MTDVLNISLKSMLKSLKLKIKYLILETLTAFLHIIPISLVAIVIATLLAIFIKFVLKKEIDSFILGVASSIFVSYIFYFHDFIYRNRENKKGIYNILTMIYNGYQNDKSKEHLQTIFNESNKINLVNASTKLHYKYNYNKIMLAFIAVETEINKEQSSEKSISNYLYKFEKESKEFYAELI